MAWQSQTLSELIDRVEQDFSARFFGSAAPLRRSVMKVLARIWAAIVFLLTLLLEWVYRNSFVHLCDDDQIELHGIQIGVYPGGGGYSSGSVLVTGGTPGVTIPQNGTVIQDPNDSDIKYDLTDDYEIPASGELSIGITSQDAGSAYNQLPEAGLEFESASGDWDTAVTVDESGVYGGDDDEEPEDYRDRVLYKKRNPPQGGAESDYVIKATSYPNVTDAYITEGFPNANNVQVVLSDNDKIEIGLQPLVADVDVQRVQAGITDPSWKPLTSAPVASSIEMTNVTLRVRIKPNTPDTRTSATNEVKSLFSRVGIPKSTISEYTIAGAISDAYGVSSVVIDELKQDAVLTDTVVTVYNTGAWLESIVFGDLA